MRNTVHVAAHLFFINDRDEILLQRRFNTGFHDGLYGLPSGHAEKGETATEDAIREAFEESNLIVEAKDLSVVHIMYYLKESAPNDYNCFFLRAMRWHGVPKIMEPDKCDDLSWFPLKALPDNMIIYIRAAIEDYLKGHFYSEWRNGA